MPPPCHAWPVSLSERVISILYVAEVRPHRSCPFGHKFAKPNLPACSCSLQDRGRKGGKSPDDERARAQNLDSGVRGRTAKVERMVVVEMMTVMMM